MSDGRVDRDWKRQMSRSRHISSMRSNSKSKMSLLAAKASRATRAKRSLFRSRSMANASRRKSCARKNNSPKAELVGLLEPSPHRVLPECPYFGRCGGCSYQHISYEHQLELKARQVEQAMRRIGRLAEPTMRPMIPSASALRLSEPDYGSRPGQGRRILRRDAHQLMDIKRCSIATPEVNEALAELQRWSAARWPLHVARTDRSRVFAQTNDDVAEALVTWSRACCRTDKSF